jgi:PAS domain S-box-containing protein
MTMKPQALPRRLRRASAAVLGSLACLLAFQTVGWAAASGSTAQRILLLEGLTPTQPAGLRTLEAFKNRLKEKGGSKDIEIFIEFLELGRFPGEAHRARVARYLSETFAEKPPDLVIPISRGALEFLMQYRDIVAPNIPVLYCCTAAAAATALNLPRGIVGVVNQYDWSKTLDLAERLQPDARDLAIVSGASPYDREWLEDLQRELESRMQRYHARYLTGLPYDRLLREVAELPHNTIILMAPLFADGTGRPHAPPEAAAEIAGASSAPAYAPIDTFFGTGIVGGFMDSYEAQGIAVADLALRVLNGEDPATLPVQTTPLHTFKVDARQLNRWGLSKRDVPADATVLFKTPTLWEQHRTAVLGTAAAFGLQTIVVGLLIEQARKRKRAERSLRESEERLAFAAASANVGIWRLDLKTNDLWLTDHCRSMFGFGAGQPTTLRGLLDAVHPEDRHILDGSMALATKQGAPVGVEFRVAVPGKDVRWLVARGHSIADPVGSPLRFSGIFADITDRKTAEADLEMQRQEVSHLMRVSVLGELSGAIAHELNQPLTAILAYAQAARRILDTKNPQLDRIADVLDDIVHEDNRASEVIRRLHGLLRRGEAKSEAVSLNDLVESTLRLLHSELISRKIRVDVVLENNLAPISGDPIQLQQVLLNLFVNAMDAMNGTPASERLLVVKTRAAGGGMIEASISDRGRGIPETERSKIFVPFFTTKNHGLGLGLSICAKIVKAHGGRLKIDNNAEGGVTASIALPVSTAAELVS